MPSRRIISWFSLALLPALAPLSLQRDASAESYPANVCASEKLEIAAAWCDKTLKAWSIWDKTQNDRQLGKSLVQASRTFDRSWIRAERKAARQGVDCADMTLSAAGLENLMESAVDDIVTEINGGLDLAGEKKHAICGGKLLKFAATKCQKLLKAESDQIKQLADDPDGDRRDAVQAKASRQFAHQWSKAVRRSCPTTASEAEIESKIDMLSADALANITVSPNVPDDRFMAITHPAVGARGHQVAYEGDILGPRCQDSSQYSFFARRGTENKLLMYYEGGGACWETLTCGLPRCKQDVDPDAFLAATQSGFGGGFADLSNPDNPFKDWNIVYVPYCSCDVHWGDSAVDYPELIIVPGAFEFPEKHVEHRGYDNAKLAEKWAREHFVNPSDVFVSGSSAGAYGATVHGIHLNEVYPASNISMLADAGNGVITQEFLEEQFGNWGVEEHLPDIPGIGDVAVTEQSIPSMITAAASFYPRANWGHYTAAYDGGSGGQTGFYHVMLNPDNFFVWLNWWESSCAFNAEMRQQALATEASVSQENDNYRYYIASGSAHTGFGRDRIYTDTTGGVPTLVDWVNAMIDDTPAWTSVEANPSNVLFPGQCSAGSDNPGDPCGVSDDCPNGSCEDADPRPSPLRAPFEINGTDTIVNCGP